MTNTRPAPPPETPMMREEKQKAKVHNERMKLLSSLFHSLALAVFGLSALRILLDPAAHPLAPAVIILAVVSAVVLEAIAYYILGKMKAES